MYTGDFALNFNERLIFNLRSLYSKRGYNQYKMSKFEEYDLYAKNKDFLISDSVITFTDTNGKLMALKPDVTLSIIKNTSDQPKSIQKVFYNENVYRIAKGTNTFKEIMQSGLECFGDIDNYAIAEVLTLACKSLKMISKTCVLDVSHLGIITEVLEYLNLNSSSKKDILKYISEKNAHELSAYCTELGLDEKDIEVLKSFISSTGKPNDVLNNMRDSLSDMVDVKLINDLIDIISSLDDDIKDMIRIDFSVVSSTHYYNNIVFKGFIEGVPTSVLTGGQYDKLMKKMKRKSGAIGFAVYLDALERLFENSKSYDVDTVLLYDDSTNLDTLNKRVSALMSIGESVYACKVAPEGLKYKKRCFT